MVHRFDENQLEKIMKNALLSVMLCILAETALGQLQFKNSLNSPIMQVGQTGIVGIGITNPDAASRLDVNGQVYTTGFQLVGGGTTNGYILTGNTDGTGSWRAPTGMTLDWVNGTSVATHTQMAQRRTSDADFQYTDSLQYEYIPSSGNGSEMMMRLMHRGNNRQATLRATGDTARVILKSVGMSYPVILKATPKWPGAASVNGSNNRLYINGGIVTAGTANRFSKIVCVGRTHAKTTTDGFLLIGTPSDAVTEHKLTANGQCEFYGRVYSYNMQTGTGTDIQVQDNGELTENTSSIRFKENIQPFVRDFDALLKADPVEFTYKENGRRSIGYIAEQLVALGLDDLVTRDISGQVYGIAYDKLPIYLLEIIKENEKLLRKLEN